MVVLEMFFQRIVVPIVMRIPGIPPIADKTALVLVPTVLVQLVIVVKALAAEGAQRMAPEAGLMLVAGAVVAVGHVAVKLLVAEQLVLVGEDLLVPGAQVAHLFLVLGAHVAVQVGPAQGGRVARQVRAVVAEEQHGVADDVLAGVADADVVVG